MMVGQNHAVRRHDHAGARTAGSVIAAPCVETDHSRAGTVDDVDDGARIGIEQITVRRVERSWIVFVCCCRVGACMGERTSLPVIDIDQADRTEMNRDDGWTCIVSPDMGTQGGRGKDGTVTSG
jgi:hypothetical protein